MLMVKTKNSFKISFITKSWRDVTNEKFIIANDAGNFGWLILVRWIIWYFKAISPELLPPPSRCNGFWRHRCRLWWRTFRRPWLRPCRGSEGTQSVLPTCRSHQICALRRATSRVTPCSRIPCPPWNGPLRRTRLPSLLGPPRKTSSGRVWSYGREGTNGQRNKRPLKENEWMSG